MYEHRKIFGARAKNLLKFLLTLLKWRYKQRIVAAKYGLHPYSMHPVWIVVFKEHEENYAVGQIPWRLSQIHSEKEVDTILGTYYLLLHHRLSALIDI